jgi:carbon starvation protein CstA
MARLDRTIALPKIALTGVFALMVRTTSRAMTMDAGRRAARLAIGHLWGVTWRSVAARCRDRTPIGPGHDG